MTRTTPLMSWARTRLRTGGDDGIALVVTMMVMIVAASLVILVVGVAVTTGKQSGRDRQRTVAINAAEAAVDASYAILQSSGTTLPCAWPASGTSSMSSSPDNGTARATITYYKSDGTPLGHCLTSADVTTNSTFQAVIDGYGQASSNGTTTTRHMQALVTLTPVYANSVDQAIFANGNITFNNNTTLTGDGTGANADIYTNTDFTCANNESFAGNVHSQGSITVSGSCTIAGDAWAKNSVGYSSGSNGSVGGRVLASAGSITLPGNFNVNGTLLAGGSINWAGCSASGKCYANTTVSAPPYIPFPILYGNSATADADWTGNGFTIYTDNNCSTITSDIINTYAKKGTKTLVKTSCPVAFSKNKTIPMSNDLAIYSYGGFSSSQQVSFASSVSGVKRNLYWVVPYDAATSLPCSSPSITTDNLFNFTTDVNMLVYDPCNISFSNSSTHIGQVYGGSSVTINNKFAMQFQKVPVFGVDPSSTPVLSFKVDIAYKREVGV